MSNAVDRLNEALTKRYVDAPRAPDDVPAADELARMAARASCRRFDGEPVDAELLRVLCAISLAAPSKSDLQQRDIVRVTDPAIRQRLAELIDQEWVPAAPELLVFCGNNHRQLLVHEWRGVPFANDHLDAFFNAAVDAGIALATFVDAAEAAGLGCCPISAIRNHPQEVSDLLGLPPRVFPVAGLGVGWPAREGLVTKRLPLSTTVHENRFSEHGLREAVDGYDRWRHETHPYRTQRHTDRFGTAEFYGWSEDKARHYSAPERETFGAFVKAKGFKLE